MIEKSDYEYFQKYFLEKTGLQLGPNKEYLVETRLLSIIKKHGIKDMSELAVQLGFNNNKKLLRDVIDAMTTNETLFFRDAMPYEVLENYALPKLLRARSGSRSLRIWSAACSSGQEPYSIAMTLDSFPTDLSEWNVEILATDLSWQILEKARMGVYSAFEVGRGLADEALSKHFDKKGDDWMIKDKIKSRIRFEELNLIEPFAHIGTFDIVFCRNVLIYFDHETKARILDNIARILTDDGYLVLGAAESASGLTKSFKRVEETGTGFYQKAGVRARCH